MIALIELGLAAALASFVLLAGRPCKWPGLSAVPRTAGARNPSGDELGQAFARLPDDN
jgi:hypothetical protein